MSAKPLSDRRAQDRRHTHSTNSMIEDLQSVLLDCLIEHGLHLAYQAELLESLPAEARERVASLLQEDREFSAYFHSRIRAGLDILAEARPGPDAYNPERPAIRLVARPFSEVMA